MRINTFLGICAILVFSVPLFGQRFGAGLTIGLNASQIQGDQLAGFDKLGLLAGINGTVHISEKVDIGLDMLYSVRGSKPDIFNPDFDPEIDITLKYFDVPVYAMYNDWYHPEKEFFRVFALGGFSYARLIDASTFDQFNQGDDNLDALVPYFNSNDFSWLLGLGFRPGRHFAISMRYTRSINLLLNAEKESLNTTSLRPFFLSFRFDYIL